MQSDLPALAIPPWPRHLLRAAWAVALAGVIVLSLHPEYGPPGAFELDKFAHALGYGVLAAMPFAAFAAGRTVLWTALAMLPLGLMLEGLQSLVPGRFADPVDAVFNALGVVLGLVVGPRLRRLANRIFAAAAKDAPTR